MTETTTIRGALIMPYPSALGSADEPLTIEWLEGHSHAVLTCHEIEDGQPGLAGRAKRGPLQ